MRLATAGLGAVFLLPALVLGCGSDTGDGTPETAVNLEPREYRRGMELVEMGNLRGAAMQFKRSTTKHPDFLEAYYQLAEAYVEMGPGYADFFDSAAVVYDQIQARVGEDDLRLQKGICLLKMISWQVDEALTMAEDLLANSPEDCDLWVLMGDAEKRKAMHIREVEGYEQEAELMKVAEESYRKALEFCPDHLAAYRAIGLIMDQRKQYTEVAKMYDDLLTRLPDNVHVLRQCAGAHFRSRHWKRAAELLARILELDPDPKDRLQYISALRNSDQFDLADEQVRIHQETAPKEEGPKELTRESRLRDELGITEASARAGELMEKEDFSGALAIWKDARARLNEKLNDPEWEDAAETVAIWLDRRIQYTEGLVNN